MTTIWQRVIVIQKRCVFLVVGTEFLIYERSGYFTLLHR